MGVKDALTEKVEGKGAVKLTKSMSIADMIKAMEPEIKKSAASGDHSGAFYPYGIVSTEYYPEACGMQSDVFSWGSDECSTAGTGTKYPIGTGLSDPLPK